MTCRHYNRKICWCVWFFFILLFCINDFTNPFIYYYVLSLGYFVEKNYYLFIFLYLFYMFILYFFSKKIRSHRNKIEKFKKILTNNIVMKYRNCVYNNNCWVKIDMEIEKKDFYLQTKSDNNENFVINNNHNYGKYCGYGFDLI